MEKSEETGIQGRAPLVHLINLVDAQMNIMDMAINDDQEEGPPFQTLIIIFEFHYIKVKMELNNLVRAAIFAALAVGMGFSLMLVPQN
ncbi:MAG: hypothetical protein CM1200mP10_24520 [Candidatus Neomarinimicrobiota bacterium]|nr:MAG: hypothetical protein CM1200mP10_24520 [Candidatus Neomarinimicrobiota bacterium]